MRADDETARPEREHLLDTRQDQVALKDRSVEPCDRLEELEIVEERMREEMERRGR